MLAEILPGKAFHGKGANQGPSVVMIDDSSSEKEEFWPNITIDGCGDMVLIIEFTTVIEFV